MSILAKQIDALDRETKCWRSGRKWGASLRDIGELLALATHLLDLLADLDAEARERVAEDEGFAHLRHVQKLYLDLLNASARLNRVLEMLEGEGNTFRRADAFRRAARRASPMGLDPRHLAEADAESVRLPPDHKGMSLDEVLDDLDLRD